MDFESFCPELESQVVPVQDFPEPGILFHDLTPVLSAGPLFEKLISALADRRQLGELPVFSVLSR